MQYRAVSPDSRAAIPAIQQSQSESKRGFSPLHLDGGSRASGANAIATSSNSSACASYDGAVLLSGYDNPLYAPLERAGWDRVEVDVVCSASGRTQTSGLQGAGSALSKQRRTEVLWRNPETRRRLAQ